MITESRYARDELLRIANLILKKKKRYSGDWLLYLEMKVFIGAFLIRKLLHSNKLPDDLLTSIKLTSYLKLPGTKNTFSIRYPEDNFDGGEFRSCNLSLKALCDQLIHSYIFHFTRTRRSMKPLGMIFTSERKLNEKIYQISMNQYASVLKKVALAQPNRSSSGFDPVLGRQTILQRVVRSKKDELKFLRDSKKYEDDLMEKWKLYPRNPE